MPPDIRSFFGGKAGESSQEKKPAPKPEAKTAKPKGRGKRKVVSDSDDDDSEQPVPKKATPQQAPPKKAAKKESPKGEATTTSDYFASSSKSKPTRSTPVRPKPTAMKNDLETTPEIKSAKPSPKKSAPASSRSTKTSSRTQTRKRYAEISNDEDEDDLPVIKLDDDSGEDIFKAGDKKMQDEYESDEDDIPIKPTRQRRKKDGPSDSVVLSDEEDQPKGKKLTKPASSRKRKSAEVSENEDDEEPSAKKKPASKKPRAPAKKKEEAPESKEIQSIFDSIPTVRPPTPPPRDPNQKFDFRSNMAQRAQPPPSEGTKEIPEGKENCLIGLTFVFTGVNETLGREQGIELVKRYGGKITTAPSGKTDYVVLGSDAGPKKLETIAKLKIKTINEDGFFELIRRLPANGGDGKGAAKAEEKKQAEENKIKLAAQEMEQEEKQRLKDEKITKAAANVAMGRPAATNSQPEIDNRLWTVKYAPTQLNHICGNKSQIEKLQNWLRNWRYNAKKGFKLGGKDGSGLYRAVIIYGGPGIGKTTAAHLAAKLEGFDVVESNASDTRSKKLVESGLKGVLDTTSLLGYFAGDGKKAEATKKNLVLIMDEVDGMSAGDRGGVGALAALCKKTNVPMILICNERRSPKMKPFDHCTYGLGFSKPTTDQVRSRILTILFREQMKDLIPTSVVNALIEGSNADIRQVINMISTAKVDQQAMDFDGGKKMSSAWEKHIILKPWDLVSKILGGGLFAPSSKATLNDKIELYFNDHEFAPLMLQENYLGTNPMLSNQLTGREKNLKMLELTDKAAESISDGDLVDSMIHGSQQHWSLMPTHAVFSFVRPASFISGSMAGHQTRFTSWLGNNSKGTKLMRLVKDIQGHMRLRASGDRHEIRQQYLPVLWTRLVKALEVHGDTPEGIDEIIDLMDSYFLTKDDWDAILELGIGSQRPENVSLSTANKTRFTRMYNLKSHPLPFMKASGANLGPAKKSKDKPDLEEAVEASEDDEVLIDEGVDSEDEALDLKKDKYVSAPKKKKAAPKKSAPKKGKKAKDMSDEEISDGASEEEVKPKGKGRGKAAAGKGRAKK